MASQQSLVFRHRPESGPRQPALRCVALASPSCLAARLCLSSAPVLLNPFSCIPSDSQLYAGDNCLIWKNLKGFLPGLCISVPARRSWCVGHCRGGWQLHLPLPALFVSPEQLLSPGRPVVLSNDLCTGRMCVCCFLTLGKTALCYKNGVEGPPAGFTNLCGSSKTTSWATFSRATKNGGLLFSSLL